MLSLYGMIVTGILQVREYSDAAGNRLLRWKRANKEKDIELYGENHYTVNVDNIVWALTAPA
jgi:hypothetical protein